MRHTYKIGDIVWHTPGMIHGAPGEVEIVRQMPEVEREPQYRVRSRADGQERACGEATLRPLSRH